MSLCYGGPIQSITLRAVRLKLQGGRTPRLGSAWLIRSQLLQLRGQIPDLCRTTIISSRQYPRAQKESPGGLSLLTAPDKHRFSDCSAFAPEKCLLSESSIYVIQPKQTQKLHPDSSLGALCAQHSPTAASSPKAELHDLDQDQQMHSCMLPSLPCACLFCLCPGKIWLMAAACIGGLGIT